jgi:TolB-like protein/Tfp pilus assembly protein PilF
MALAQSLSKVLKVLMEDKNPTTYEFGLFRLLTTERLLLRAGRPVPLAPKVFETLLAFVQNRGRLLTKDELMNLIWGDTVVEEGNLTQNIFVLRKVLGETPADHRYVVTIPLQGYRFVAPVRELSADESRTGLSNRIDRAQAEGPSPITTIAVLPFSFLNPSKEEHFEGIGIADTLITKLNSLKQILIRPTTAVLRYAEAKEDLFAIGSELGVGALLDGTIQHNGDRIRVNVQLIDVNRGGTLWAAKYDEKYSDIFAVQDSIAAKVTDALEIQLSSDEMQRLTKSHTENVEAYQLYVKGRYFWETRTEQGLKKAIEYAQKAIDIDENDAMAHVGLADSYAFLGEYLYMAPQVAFPKAKEAALKAQQLDPNLAEAYASLAEVNFFYDWDWLSAEQNYKQVIEMKPNYASARHWYAWFLMAMGRFDEALDNIRKAQTIDPGSLILNTVMGLPFYFEGYYEQAIAQFRDTLEMDPHFTHARYYLGSALTQVGAFDEAADELEKVLPIEYRQQTSALLGYVYAASGQRGKARKVLKDLQVASEKSYVSPYLQAIVHTGLGETDQAIVQLERGFQERAAWMVFLDMDPFLDKLRDDSRFSDLVQRLRFHP